MKNMVPISLAFSGIGAKNRCQNKSDLNLLDRDECCEGAKVIGNG